MKKQLSNLLIATFVVCATLLINFRVKAQTFHVKATHVTHWDENSQTNTTAREDGSLATKFKRYDIFNLNVESMAAYVKGAESSAMLDLQLGNIYRWSMNIEPENLFASDAKGYVLTKDGKQEVSLERNILYKGTLLGNEVGKVRLTITETKISGCITINNERFYIESLRNLNNTASESDYIVYNSKDVLAEGDLQCQSQKDDRAQQDVNNELNSGRTSATCNGVWENQMATFATFSRYSSAGGTTQVNNEILTILNNVQGNYNEFKVKLVVVEQVVSSCSTCDPWTFSTPSNLLTSFTNWGPTGFTKTHDQGVCFFDGAGSGVVGVAWVGAICTRNRYAVCDKLGSAESNRVLVAHEMGHNFGSGHDASGTPYIMAPSVNASKQWSPASQTSINSHISSRTCLACIADNPNACNNPSGLVVENIQTTSASLNWDDAGGGATGYTVQVKAASDTVWQSYSTTTSNLNLTGLQVGRTYQWQVRTVCTATTTAFIPGTNFTTNTTTPTCGAPSGLVILSSTSTTASLDWSTVSGASTYRFEIKTLSATTWQGFTVSNSNVNISGMQAGVTYQWRVRTNCTNGTVSTYTSGPNINAAAASAILDETPRAINVAPNPFSNTVTIKVNSPTSEFVDVEVISVSGSSVYQQNKHNADTPLILGETLPVGMYFIRVKSQTSVHVTKVIKN